MAEPLPKLGISVMSTEFVRVPVSLKKNGVPFNPTGDQVSMAFLPRGSDPTSGDWNAGDWETEGTKYWARRLIGSGTGGLPLAKGRYVVWIRVVDNPEIPARPFASLTVR